MALTRAIAAALALAFAFACVSARADDEPARLEALMAELRRTLPPVSEAPQGRILPLAPGGDVTRTLAANGIEAMLQRLPDAYRLTIRFAGRTVHDAPLRLPPDAPAGLAIAEFDPDNAMPEIVAGIARADGACCVRFAVLTGRSDGPGFDPVGPPRGLTDVVLRDHDGDRRFEAFATKALVVDGGRCRPCRAAVPAVFQLSSGAWFDVSHEPAFRPHHGEALAGLLRAQPREASARHDVLVSVAALAARLGLVETVWPLLRRHDMPDRETRRAIAETLREHGLVPRSLPLEPRR